MSNVNLFKIFFKLTSVVDFFKYSFKDLLQMWIFVKCFEGPTWIFFNIFGVLLLKALFQEHTTNVVFLK